MDESRIVYRRATVWDAPAIADMWELEMEEMQMLGRYCDAVEKEKFFVSLVTRIKTPDVNIVYVAEKDKKLISFILGYIYRNNYGSSDLIGFCEHRYVYPEYRKTKVATKLLAILKDMGIRMGAEQFEFVVPYREGLVKVYKRMGYNPVQIIFRKEGI